MIGIVYVIVILVVAYFAYSYLTTTTQSCSDIKGQSFICQTNGEIGTITSSGTINLYIGRLNAPEINNVSLACSVGQPTMGEYVYYGSIPEVSSSKGGYTGGRLISNIRCYDNGSIMDIKAGANMQAYIWAQYPNQSSASGANNTAIALFEAK